MDVFSPLGQNAKAMMAVQNSAVRPNLQRTRQTGGKGGFQLARRTAAKLFQLRSIQSGLGMQEFELWWIRWRGPPLLIVAHSSGISARSSARFSNLVNCPRNRSGTVPIGPFLCLAMIKSASPLMSSRSRL